MIHNSKLNAMAEIRRELFMMALLFFTSGAAKAASLIVNGSFENGPDPELFMNMAGGTTSITGWVVTGEGVDYVGSLWPASEGSRSIDLDGSKRSRISPPFAQGGIAQTFATKPGTRYRVTFDLAGNPFDAPAKKPMRVSAAGQQMEFKFDMTGKSASKMGWLPQSWLFTAKDGLTTLEFRSLTISPSTGYGAVIDNVSVTTADSLQ